MTTIDDTVRECITFYPSLFETRGDVLDFILFVPGNGYAWVDGEIKNVTRDEREKPWTPEHEYERLNQYDNFLHGLLRESVEKSIREYQHIVDTIEDRIGDYTVMKDRDRAVFPRSTNHTLYGRMTENVSPEWAAEIALFTEKYPVEG